MQKLAVIFVIIQLFIACNQQKKTVQTGSNDNVENIYPNKIPETFTDSAREFSDKKIDALKTQIDFFPADHPNSVAELATIYTPKEVYIEVLRRTGDLSKDTIPSVIKDNYSSNELERIIEKNRNLNKLTGKDILSLYQKSFRGAPLIVIGDDNRRDILYDPIHPEIKGLANTPEMDEAKCVVAIIPKDSMGIDEKGNYVFKCSITYKDLYELCNNERFINQPAFSKGTGFVVDSQRLVTASHCVDSMNYKDYYFVFDYIVDNKENCQRVFAASKVFEGVSVINEYDKSKSIDYSIVKLNKSVPRFRIPRLKKTGKTGEGLIYHVIGTSGGLPLKVADDARVWNNNSPDYFTIGSDTYGGNSGAPVFNSNTHEIEGILVSGGLDYKKMDDVECRISVKCPFRPCKYSQDGEYVSRVSQFLSKLSKN